MCASESTLFRALYKDHMMARLEVKAVSTPPSTSSSSSASTCDSSESSDDNSVSEVSCRRCMNPGRRLIGGRIYDSVLGVTCHWCRQKTVEDHVFCCHCPLAFCGGCLRNRHGEDIEVEMKEDVDWTCPRCRGGCGPGCKNCCNCGPCRKVQGLDPTGLLVHKARANGFTNVHDYLIHQKTGESEETIAKRKQGKGWCQTDASLFRKKQKGIEIENGIETTCRKRLNFVTNDDDLQEKRRNESFQSNGLQVKEATLASSMPEFEELSHAGSKVSLKEQARRVSKPPSLRVQPKREPDPHECKEPCQKRANYSPGKDSNTQPLQPKLVPDSHAQGKPRNTAAVLLLGDAMDVRTSNEGNAQQLLTAKEKPSEHCSQAKHNASSVTLATSRRVKKEEVPLCDGDVRQVKTTLLDQPGQFTEGPNIQLICVKEECQDQRSQPSCNNGFTDKPNTSDAAFSRVKGDATWCRPTEGLEPPSEDVGGSASTSALLDCGIPRYSSDARSLASSCVSNFHLYPETFLPLFSRVKEEVVDEECIFISNDAVKRESMSSQDAQCSNDASCGPFANKVGSMDATQYPGSSPVCKRIISNAGVKDEPEDNLYTHCPSLTAKSTTNSSYTNNLFSNVRVKTEWEDVSFTIKPAVCANPFISKTESFSSRHVKQEVINDMPPTKVVCIDDDEALAASENDKVEIPAGLKKSSSLGSVSHPWKVNDFKMKLEAKLSEPFSRKELEELEAAASHRKPICKVRETRQGHFPFMSEEEGFSYLDHHPEMYKHLKEASSPIAKLSLLRGLFFWLEHASMQGAFKPWTFTPRPTEVQENDDCVEIEGPDCEILAVVCSVDEEVNAEKLIRMRRSFSTVS